MVASSCTHSKDNGDAPMPQTAAVTEGLSPKSADLDHSDSFNSGDSSMDRCWFDPEAAMLQTECDEMLLPQLSTMLDGLVAVADELPLHEKGDITVFHGDEHPGISIHDYLLRIRQYLIASSSCFVAALIYVDRLLQRHPNVKLTSLCFHRLFLTSIRVATKYFEDSNYHNAYWAIIGGVTISELNGLELEFLFRLNFDLLIKPSEYRRYRAAITDVYMSPGSSPKPSPVASAATVAYDHCRSLMFNGSTDAYTAPVETVYRNDIDHDLPMDTATTSQSLQSSAMQSPATQSMPDTPQTVTISHKTGRHETTTIQNSDTDSSCDSSSAAHEATRATGTVAVGAM